MARPNSKYFASVITKLIAAKRKENIVIDESFKMQLRNDLLDRAAGSSSLLEEIRPLDIGAMFARWKYALAVVPSALVVLLIAVKFVNMPVSIPGEQILPTGSQETSVSEEDVQLPVETADSESALVPVNSHPPMKKLRTFPGALILPRVVDEDSSLETFPVKNEELDVKETDVENIEPKRAMEVLGEVNEVLPPAPLSFTIFGFQVNHQDEKDTNDTVLAHREERIDRGELIPDIVDETPVAVLPTENVVQKLEKPIEFVSAQPVAQPVPQPLVEGGVVESFQAVQTVPVLEPVVPTLRFMEYGVDLQPLKREKLENQVVPSLIGDRAIENVYVSEKEKGIVSVEILFENGEKVQEFYTFNERTNVWDTVHYVTHQYYDDSLSYTSDFQYQISPYSKSRGAQYLPKRR